ncbi:MAG: hypothetical protein QXV14_05845 [Candidatus Caldarchaeum sp.]
MGGGFIDVHASVDRGRRGGQHLVFDRRFCVREARLVDFLAVEGDEVYVDLIPSATYDGVWRC